MGWLIHTASDKLRAGQLSPVTLLEQCFERIDRLERHVQAWVFVDRDRARAEAEMAEAEIRKKEWRGPLHGIPLGIKDIIDVFDWPTAAGSRLWERSIARRDATVVDRLRQAGAVLVGKTVTTQYASFDPPPTRNPRNLKRTPGGSSSGSAAAVACEMCLGSLGTQTGGSITRPASYCGVASCKPTFSRVSVDGVVPLAASMDHVGPMANCVQDLAILLQAIAGPDARDPGCGCNPVPNLLASLSERQQPPRLARLHGLFDELAVSSVRELMDQVSERLRKAGATIREAALPAGFAEVLNRHRTVMAVEAAAFHEFRLRRHPEDYKPNIRTLLEEGLACPAPEYARCKVHQRELSASMLGCLEGVDALLIPGATGPAPGPETTGDPAFNSPWSYTGLPTVSVPAGWTVEGLPLAIQLVGPPWSEADLFSAALWCEQTLGTEKREVQP